jgi:hypothetical protein
VENNARLNGSSYTLALIDNLALKHGPIPCWKFFKAKTEPCTFPELLKRLSTVVYKGNGINAIFPTDCDTLAETGAFAPVIVAEDLYHVQYLQEALAELNVHRI